MQLANETEDELKRERMKGRKEVGRPQRRRRAGSGGLVKLVEKLRLFGQSAAIGIAAVT